MVAQSNAMNKLTTFTAIATRALELEALSNISASFELFCPASGVEALGAMMDHAAQAICDPRHARGRYRQGYRWEKTKARSASTAARSKSIGPGFAALTRVETLISI
jgi:hypothetical protein